MPIATTATTATALVDEVLLDSASGAIIAGIPVKRGVRSAVGVVAIDQTIAWVGCDADVPFGIRSAECPDVKIDRSSDLISDKFIHEKTQIARTGFTD
ncbi:MAG: hypothetical protein HRU71_13005 [Planctomycetia bacterium]|nr:MAG: hypothetical protein HRU71_13005 [Planctomycetia bacterium]